MFLSRYSVCVERDIALFYVLSRVGGEGRCGGLAGWTYGTISCYGLSGSQVRFEWLGISYYLFDVSDSWCLVRVASHSMIARF